MFKRRSRRYRSRGVPRRNRAALTSTQEKVEGYSLDAYQSARIMCVGTGGIGLWVAKGLLLKGVGRLDLYDDDVVDWPNLTRQPFAPRDVGQYKVRATARLLVRDALYPITITAHPRRFQECFD